MARILLLTLAVYAGFCVNFEDLNQFARGLLQ